jgi:hypothetical protein
MFCTVPPVHSRLERPEQTMVTHPYDTTTDQAPGTCTDRLGVLLTGGPLVSTEPLEHGWCWIPEVQIANGEVRSLWMRPGEAYDLVYDGSGWTVTGAGWMDPTHTYYLSRKLVFTSRLPVEAEEGMPGWRMLEPGRRYVLRPDGDVRWVLWQA